MAEFQEVIRQARRMCEYYEGFCAGCMFDNVGCLKSLDFSKASEQEIDEFENELIEWAEYHDKGKQNKFSITEEYSTNYNPQNMCELAKHFNNLREEECIELLKNALKGEIIESEMIKNG